MTGPERQRRTPDAAAGTAATRAGSGLNPRRWGIWGLQRRTLVVVGVVHVLALALLLFAATDQGPASTAQWSFAAVAAGAFALGYLAETRVGTAGLSSQTNQAQHDAWLLSLAVLCPSWLMMAAVAAGYASHHMLWALGARPSDGRSMVPYKSLFNISSWAVCGYLAHQVYGPIAAGLGGGPGQLVGMLVAAAVLLVTTNLSMASVLIAEAVMPLRVLLREQLLDARGCIPVLTLGALVVVAWQSSPVLILLALPLFLALQRALMHQQLLVHAQTDAKTGLANAEFWRQSADAHVVRAMTGGPALSLLVVDLDHFKRVNDTYGHLAGDDVLREVAQRLKAAVRPNDLVGRFGGEEFTVLLPGASPEDAHIVAERVRQALAGAPVAAGTAELEVTCSVGAASVLPGMQTALADVLARADLALYAAKEGGRNQVRAAPLAAELPAVPAPARAWRRGSAPRPGPPPD